MTSPSRGFRTGCLSIFFLLLTGAFSCAPVVPDTPQGVGQAFLTAYRDMDFKLAERYATDLSSMTLQFMDNVKANVEPGYVAQAKARSLSFAQVVEEGNTAQLYYTLGSNDPAVLNLVREEGRWKVDFRMEL